MVWLPGGGNQNGAASDKSPLSGSRSRRRRARREAQRHRRHPQLSPRRVRFLLAPGPHGRGLEFGQPGPARPASGTLVHYNALAFGGYRVRDPSSAISLLPRHVPATWFPQSRGLFHRAISESGGCTTYRKTQADAEKQVTSFAEAVGCGTTTDQLGCSRGKSTKESAGRGSGPRRSGQRVAGRVAVQRGHGTLGLQSRGRR